VTATHDDDGPGLKRAEIVGVALGWRLIAGKQSDSILRHKVFERGPTLINISPIRTHHDDGLAIGQRLNREVCDSLPGTGHDCATGGRRHPIGQREVRTDSRTEKV
jgi:hypothetical protein